MSERIRELLMHAQNGDAIAQEALKSYGYCFDSPTELTNQHTDRTAAGLLVGKSKTIF